MPTRIDYSESVAGLQQKLRKGDVVQTAAGDKETVVRVNSNGNIETLESQYSWCPRNLKKVTKP